MESRICETARQVSDVCKVWQLPPKKVAHSQKHLPIIKHHISDTIKRLINLTRALQKRDRRGTNKGYAKSVHKRSLIYQELTTNM